MDDFQQVDRHLTPDQRLMARAAYFGLCTYVDALIGEVLDCLDAICIHARTTEIYTSDHGDNVGARGLWGKSNMYEESAGIPMILSGAGFAEDAVCETPVSLLDSYKSILDATGLSPTDEDETVGGESLREIAGRPFDPERTVFSEYHAVASPSGAFMVRRGRYKFIYYADFPPEFFDLVEDPEETTNRAADSHYAEIVAEYESLLRSICDPEKIDRNAKDDQNELTARFGGPDAAFNIGTPGATPVPGQGHE